MCNTHTHQFSMIQSIYVSPLSQTDDLEHIKNRLYLSAFEKSSFYNSFFRISKRHIIEFKY